MRRSTFFISIQVRGSVSTDTCRDARAVVRSEAAGRYSARLAIVADGDVPADLFGALYDVRRGRYLVEGRDDRSIAPPAATMTIAMTEAMRTRTDARRAGTAPPAAVIAA